MMLLHMLVVLFWLSMVSCQDKTDVKTEECTVKKVFINVTVTEKGKHKCEVEEVHISYSLYKPTNEVTDTPKAEVTTVPGLENEVTDTPKPAENIESSVEAEVNVSKSKTTEDINPDIGMIGETSKTAKLNDTNEINSIAQEAYSDGSASTQGVDGSPNLANLKDDDSTDVPAKLSSNALIGWIITACLLAVAVAIGTAVAIQRRVDKSGRCYDTHETA